MATGTKKKKKKKGAGKTAIGSQPTIQDIPEETREASETEEEEMSEEDSPKKSTSNRAARVGLARKCVYRNCEALSQMLRSIDDQDLKEWGDRVFRAWYMGPCGQNVPVANPVRYRPSWTAGVHTR